MSSPSYDVDNDVDDNDEIGEKASDRPPKSSFDQANVISRTLCCYVLPFLIRHYDRGDISLREIDACPVDDRCDPLANRFRAYWDRARSRKCASLRFAILRCFGPQFLWQNFKNFAVYCVMRMGMPLLLGRIIYHASEHRNAEQIPSTPPVQCGAEIHQWEACLSQIFPPLQSREAKVIFYCCCLGVTIFLNTCVSHPYYMCKFRYGMNVRVAVSRLIYEKALRTTSAAVRRVSPGKIVNMMANDVNRIDSAYVFISFLYMSIVAAAIAMFLLYAYIGQSSFGALVCVLLYLPLQTIMASVLSRFRNASIALTDARLRHMAELLPAIRVIKMYVWERPFAALVGEARRREITKIRHSMLLRAINLALYFVASKVMSFVCIVAFLTIERRPLTPEIVFVTMALVQQIREVVTFFFPLALTHAVEVNISLKRIEKFLLEEEVNEPQANGEIYRHHRSTSEDRETPEIVLRHVTVMAPDCDGSRGAAILRDINLRAKMGQLTAIIGAVGSGKSSILLSILGELPITTRTATTESESPMIRVNGRLAYVSQEASLFPATVRENILFGRKYCEQTYAKVIEMAALRHDFDHQLTNGDRTVVDDRGASLSGGQRARISLARALYTGADCFLLDDPLSAVDSAVAKHIFDRCIRGHLRRKTVLLVTHQLQFVKQADQIVVMKEGAILGAGSYFELLNRGVDLFKYSQNVNPPESGAASPEAGSGGEPELSDSKSEIGHPDTPYPEILSPSVDKAGQCSNPFRFPVYSHTNRRRSSSEGSIDSGNSSNIVNEIQASKKNSIDSQRSFGVENFGRRRSSQSFNPNDSHSDGNVDVDVVNKNCAATKFEEDSDRNSNSAASSASKFKVYWTYVAASKSIVLLTIFVSANITTQILFTGSDYWLSLWTDREERRNLAMNQSATNRTEESSIVSDDLDTNIFIYTILIGSLFTVAIIRAISFFWLCMRSSVNLHNGCFRSLLQAPIRFFDCTPFGVIMNRVSRDLAIIDDQLPPTAFEAIEILGNSFAIFALCTALNPYIAIPCVALAAAIFAANRLYIDTARKLKRLEGAARSPIYQHLSSSLAGLCTIRAYAAQRTFLRGFARAQDRHTATYFTYLSASRAYGIFLEFVSVAYICALMAVMCARLDAYTGSVIGLTISQSLMLTNTFNWGIRQATELETFMTSVERVAEFANLEKENLGNENEISQKGECKSTSQKPPENWPQSGEIVYENVSLTYSSSSTKSKSTNDRNAAVESKQEIGAHSPPATNTVLRDISFRISGGEKVGIVGRTGAGKSSLFVTLFRLIAPTSGKIYLDGVDTGEIGLARLRSAISIIPQEPIMFSGTVRRNLDPFGARKDGELWDAIEKVELKAKIAGFGQQLQCSVSSGGSGGGSGVDFSVGEKQLICLARAILRRNRVLILDEATANVDPRTDALIQRTIRAQFADCTVLTIAHRLNTIIDYDRVMVLDAGKIVQFAKPAQLIAAKSGLFYRLFASLTAEAQNEIKKKLKI